MLDLDAVDRLLAHCHLVVDASRAARVERYEQRLVFGPRGVTPRLAGGAGTLGGARVLLVTDDYDARDLMRLLLVWFGATVMTTSLDRARGMATMFHPELVLVDLSFDRQAAFTLARRLHGGPRLVALTKHHHDHPPHEALEAGFDGQVDEPLNPE